MRRSRYLPTVFSATLLLLQGGFPTNAQSQMSIQDCSVYRVSMEAFNSCMESNRIAIESNRLFIKINRDICIAWIDMARKAAARGDRSGWDRVPTKCIY